MKSYRSTNNGRRAYSDRGFHKLMQSRRRDYETVPCPICAELEKNPRVTVAEIAATRSTSSVFLLAQYCKLNYIPINER
jgi:hypothetical protein